jgi:hypothetical protein
VNRTQLHELTRKLLGCKTRKGLARVLRRAIKDHKLDPKHKGSWGWYFERFARIIPNGSPHSIFTVVGNSKLPFAEFSTLPKYTCPGAGPCLDWCYSFKAWRYPAGYLRQLQNTWLLQHKPSVIRQAWMALKNGITVRLYVNGDIDSDATWLFWVDCLSARQDLKAYGYSKSWEILARYNGPWPTNYVLNVSEGSRHDNDTVLRGAINTLPITRGVFGAVETKGWYSGFARYDNPEYHRDVRQSALPTHGKVFSCPGKCGSCRGGNHACGDKEFSVPIVLGVH